MVLVMSIQANNTEIEAVQQRLNEGQLAYQRSKRGKRVLFEIDVESATLTALDVTSWSGVERTIAEMPRSLVGRAFPEEHTTVTVGPVVIGDGKFVVIAGPCTVENHQQVLEIAQAIKESGAAMLRGGAYKPRTSPYSFQGLGEEALRYLVEARQATGLPIVTEVVAVEQVHRVVQYADMLQVGARNMQNYALLQAVGEQRKPVLLKRGMSATISEWLNAAEYIAAKGNSQIVLCERGIRTFSESTRNTLDLSAIPVIKARSHLPIIVDPSHASGHWHLVEPLSLAAAAVGQMG